MSDLEVQLQELLDKQALHELMMRYCRGIDRRDRELLLSVYHPDAIDDHGLFKGSPEEFADWMGIGDCVDPSLRRTLDDGSVRPNSQHAVSNEYFVIDGDVAWGECYVMARAGGGPSNGAYGRYLDRYERRGGEWRVHRRLCFFDWAPPGTGFDAAVRPFLGKDDPSYRILAGDDPS